MRDKALRATSIKGLRLRIISQRAHLMIREPDKTWVVLMMWDKGGRSEHRKTYERWKARQ